MPAERDLELERARGTRVHMPISMYMCPRELGTLYARAVLALVVVDWFENINRRALYELIATRHNNKHAQAGATARKGTIGDRLSRLPEQPGNIRRGESRGVDDADSRPSTPSSGCAGCGCKWQCKRSRKGS